MNIGGVEIGGTNPCRFVVEVSNSHNGDMRRALRLVTAAKDIGAEFVKFQAYLPSELVELRGDGPAPEPWGEQGWTMQTLYEKAQTPLAWLPDLFQYARDIGIVPFSSVFGLESLAALEKCACPAYKIASLDRRAGTLIATVGAQWKPVFVSSPNEGDEGSYFYKHVALYCPPGYPTVLGDVKLPHFHGKRGFLGLSSHCLDPLLPVAAVSRGCKLIEMHMELDFEPSELEHNICLTATEFGTMIKKVRHVESMLA